MVSLGKGDGFVPVKLNYLIRLAQLNKLTDSQMVVKHKWATLKPSAPNPSMEVILHALVPF